MLAFFAVVALLVVVWFMFGRGALIVYKHKKDEGVSIPDGMDKDQIIDVLKKDAMYPDIKEFYFDENGDICIDGKYDTYNVEIIDGRAYINDPMLEENGAFEGGNKTVSSLAKIGYWKIRLKRKNQKRVEEIECIRAYVAKAFNHNAPVNANQKYKSMKTARKYSNIISIVCTVLAVVLIIIAVSGGASDSKVNGVKDAYLKSYSDEITIGEAFNEFFSDPTWESYSEDGIDYVKFAGDCTFYDEDALMVVVFEYMENDWFKVKDIKLNGTSLNDFEEVAVLEKIFESYYD